MTSLPPGACDGHVHLFEPARFPYRPARNYTPGPATAADLLAFEEGLGFERVVLVQPSVYGTDNSCLLDGIRRLGRSVARGVAVIDEATPEEDLEELGRAGVRGVRLNLDAEGVNDPELASRRLAEAADRVRGRGWHIQLAAALPTVAALADRIESLGVPVVLDHFAGATPELGSGQPGFARLVALLRSGLASVKLSAPYRVSRRPDLADMAPLAQVLIEAAPERLVWGSDWPHPGPRRPGRGPDDVDPFHDVDDARILGLLAAWAPDPAVRRAILVDNPARLYGFGETGR